MSKKKGEAKLAETLAPIFLLIVAVLIVGAVVLFVFM